MTSVDDRNDLMAHVGFYVSVINGKKRGLVLGPYNAHSDALANVSRGRELASKIDAWADHYAFGTCKITTTKPLPASTFGV